MYGEFLQRSDWTSGGMAQYITVLDSATGKEYRFIVKPSFRSRRRNPFAVEVPPGTYVLLRYQWAQDGYQYNEPIFKGVATDDALTRQVLLGKVNPDTLPRFTLRILPNSLNYVGTWHLEKPALQVSNDKQALDSALSSQHPRLDFKTAQINFPD